MAKKMVMPVAWAQDVDCWLETLKAAGFSDDTVRSRRYKIARLCRELPSPMETTGEQITRVFAAHDWKPETRKGYRNTIAGFYRWFYETVGVVTIPRRSAEGEEATGAPPPLP